MTEDTRLFLKQLALVIVLCGTTIGTLAGVPHLPPDVQLALEQWTPVVVVAGLAWIVLRRLVRGPAKTEDAPPQPALAVWQILLVVGLFVAYYTAKVFVLTSR